MANYWDNPENKKRMSEIIRKRQIGEKNSNGKLTDNDVINIRKLAKTNLRTKEIALLYKIAYSHAYRIIHNQVRVLDDTTV